MATALAETNHFDDGGLTSSEARIRQYAIERARHIADQGIEGMVKATRHARYQRDEVSRLEAVAAQAEHAGQLEAQKGYQVLAALGRTHLEVMELSIDMITGNEAGEVSKGELLSFPSAPLSGHAAQVYNRLERNEVKLL